jgi:endonuclease YncB( thermonuclease family)
VGKASRLLGAVACVASVAAVAATAAEAQTGLPATVVGVTDGDTLTARTADGRDLTVRTIGVDAPEPGECGGDDARDALADIGQGRAVTLLTDPAIGAVDDYGRSRLYVDRTDGLDLGLEMVRRGWAAVVDAPAFARLPSYLDVEEGAEEGIWTACDGDFHLTRAERLRALRSSGKAFVRRYYRRLSNNEFVAAWRMLGRPVKRELGYSFRTWRSSHRGSLGVSARVPKARVKGSRVIVAVRLRTRDRDICNGRVVAQRFRGDVVLAPRGESLVVVRFRIHKTRGGTPRLSKSECPKPKPPPPASSPAPDCQGYDPCIGPGPDVDCAGGSGNGPRYVDGPIQVNGGDPYGLDSDGDGVACES